VLVLLLGYDC